MRSMQNPFIVQFFGCGVWDDIPFLVTEYMAFGSLTSLLNDLNFVLDWSLRIKFALDAARVSRRRFFSSLLFVALSLSVSVSLCLCLSVCLFVCLSLCVSCLYIHVIFSPF